MAYQCRKCGRDFVSAQAVRGHLRHCTGDADSLGQPRLSHRQNQPRLSLRQRQPRQNPSPSLYSDQVRDERDRLELRRIKSQHSELDRREERQRQVEREGREAVLSQVKEARAQRLEQHRLENEEAETRKRRREVIQSVKDEVLRWHSRGVPQRYQAEARGEIERRLADVDVLDLPFQELVDLSAAVRDQVYAGYLKERDRKRAEEEAEWDQERARKRQKEDLLLRAGRYLRRALHYEAKRLRSAGSLVSPLASAESSMLQELDRRLTGDETRAEVEDLVDELIDDCLEETSSGLVQ